MGSYPSPIAPSQTYLSPSVTFQSRGHHDLVDSTQSAMVLLQRHSEISFAVRYSPGFRHAIGLSCS